MVKDYKCSLCGRCHLKQRRPINTKDLKSYICKRLGRDVRVNDVICERCRALYRKARRTEFNRRPAQEETIDDRQDFIPPAATPSNLTSPRQIKLQVPSTHSSHKYCIICKKKSGKVNSLTTVPFPARTQAFIKTGIFIPSRSRCCHVHLTDKNFNHASLQTLTAKYTSSYFNRTDLQTLLENIRSTLSSKHILDFDNETSLSDDDYHNLTGLTKQQFAELMSYVSSIRASSVRSIRTCIAILLTKLRTGLSNSRLGTIFSLKNIKYAAVYIVPEQHSSRTSYHILLDLSTSATKNLLKTTPPL